MSYAFGHLIFAWIIAKGYEILSKKKLSHLTWLFILFGAILPDIDFLINWIFNLHIHRTFTHSILFVVVISLLIYAFMRIFKSKSSAKDLALAIGIGIILHLLIDLLAAPGINLLWPWNLYISYFSVGYYSTEMLLAMSSTYESVRAALNRAILDMGFGVLWLFFLWYRRRIKF